MFGVPIDSKYCKYYKYYSKYYRLPLGESPADDADDASSSSFLIINCVGDVVINFLSSLTMTVAVPFLNINGMTMVTLPSFFLLWSLVKDVDLDDHNGDNNDDGDRDDDGADYEDSYSAIEILTVVYG